MGRTTAASDKLWSRWASTVDWAERMRRQPWRVRLQPWGGDTSLEDVVGLTTAKLALREAALWPAVAGGGAESEAAEALEELRCEAAEAAEALEELRCEAAEAAEAPEELRC